MNAIAAPRIVSDPTFNHLRRTRRPLRRNASSPERPSNSIAGAMSGLPSSTASTKFCRMAMCWPPLPSTGISTFQTSGASASESHMGLMAQERVLLFLIMEISACTQNPVIL